MPTADSDVLHDPVVSEVRRRVRAAYGPRLADLYLFGSRARGEAGPDSDWDFAVVLKDLGSVWTEIEPLAAIVWVVQVETGAVVSLIPMTREDLQADRAFPRAIRQEGIVL